MIPQPLVSIITINYNSLDVTIELIESIKKISYQNIEIIVVDNASKTDPSEVLKSRFPYIKAIRSNVNLGFAGGNNLGIKEAIGEYIFFVNNDTEFTENLIEKILEPFSENSEIGFVSPKIKYFQSPNIIQYAGFTEINRLTGRNNAVGHKMEDNGDYSTSGFTHYAHGAGMIVPKKVIETVGLMPEIYFLYYEELDWCEMAKRAGFKIYFQASAVLYHKESMSIGKENPLKTYYVNRNRILFVRRNFASKEILIFLVFYTLFSLPKNLITYLAKVKFQHVSSILRGVFWNLKYTKVKQKALDSSIKISILKPKS